VLARAAALAIALGLFPAAIASADPVVAQPDTACTSELQDAMTWLPGANGPVVCTAGQWQSDPDPYPHGDRWVSTGPTLTLRGGARQNPQLDPGDWTATPLRPGERCRAEQVSVTYGKIDGPPRVDEAAAGQPMALQVIPRLLTIDLSGDCLWERFTP
jgi:hypothetical protein